MVFRESDLSVGILRDNCEALCHAGESIMVCSNHFTLGAYPYSWNTSKIDTLVLDTACSIADAVSTMIPLMVKAACMLGSAPASATVDFAIRLTWWGVDY